MKHLTLIPRDNQVYIDRLAMTVDLSDMDRNIHAIQWSEEHQRGEIEFENDPYAPPDQYKPNQLIESCKAYQRYVDAWHIAKEKADIEQAAFLKLQEELNAAASKS